MIVFRKMFILCIIFWRELIINFFLYQKTPFAETSSSEFSAFYNEWYSAPPLKMFSNDLYDDDDDDNDASTHALCLKDQLKSFESHAEEYDELVKSFHTKDLHNSHEELG